MVCCSRRNLTKRVSATSESFKLIVMAIKTKTRSETSFGARPPRVTYAGERRKLSHDQQQPQQAQQPAKYNAQAPVSAPTEEQRDLKQLETFCTQPTRECVDDSPKVCRDNHRLYVTMTSSRVSKVFQTFLLSFLLLHAMVNLTVSSDVLNEECMSCICAVSGANVLLLRDAISVAAKPTGKFWLQHVARLFDALSVDGQESQRLWSVPDIALVLERRRPTGSGLRQLCDPTVMCRTYREKLHEQIRF